MSKRNNITYVKPNEPAFLSRLKKEAGYKEGPSVDTKRESLPTYASDDSENEEQQPQIVVLNPGDLSSDEVTKAKKDAYEAPADLSKRVIFKKPENKKNGEGVSSGRTLEDSDDGTIAKKERGKTEKRKKSEVEDSSKKLKTSRQALSFDPDEEDEES